MLGDIPPDFDFSDNRRVLHRGFIKHFAASVRLGGLIGLRGGLLGGFDLISAACIFNSSFFGFEANHD